MGMSKKRQKRRSTGRSNQCYRPGGMQQDKLCTYNKETIIDLTFATPRIAQKIKNWMVLDEVTLSDHYYLSYEVDTGTQG